MKKALPAVLLLAGFVLLYFGFDEYQSLQSEVNQFFGGAGSDKAIWLLVSGAAATIAGAAGLMRDKMSD